MYDIKALYEAENVQDAIRLLTEHPHSANMTVNIFFERFMFKFLLRSSILYN